MRRMALNILSTLLLALLLVAVRAGSVRAEAAQESEQGEEVTVSDSHIIPNGISLNGVNLGGMTADEARQTVDELIVGICEGELTLTVDAQELSIAYADFDVQVTDTTAIDEICEIGTSGNLIKRYKEIADVQNNAADYSLVVEYDEAKLTQLVEESLESFNVEATDATITRTSGEFVITEAVNGVAVDAEATLSAVLLALGEDWDGASQIVEVVAEITEAEHTSKELEAITDLLGSYSTSYSSSSSNRITNITNAASFIDGTVLYPGETFSYLEHVTPVSTANGYMVAHGYSGGQVVDTVGGGICQVSSTLYNAVLRAELDIVYRINHGLTVSYVPLAADATVSEQSGVDFKFQNNLDTPVYIEAYTSGGYVYVRIYGQETRASNRTIEFTSVTDQTLTPGDDVITYDDTQYEGYTEVTQSARTGYVASLYKKVYIDGSLTETILINTSTYKAVAKQITVGTKVKETTSSTNTETTSETTSSTKTETTSETTSSTKTETTAETNSSSDSSTSSDSEAEDSNDG